MPMTPTYGFEYETPMTKPGITLTGNSDGSSPILAEQVEIALASVDARVSATEGDITTLESQVPSDTGWLALSATVAAGFSIVECIYRQWGPVVAVRIELERTGAALVANATGNIGGDPLMITIDNVAARPSRQQLVILSATNTSGSSLWGTSGVVQVRDLHSGSMIDTGQDVRMTATYFVSTFV